MKETMRFYEIDLLRFLAAVSVVFFHYTFRGYAADNLSGLYFPYLGDFFKYGYLGVQLFFIISGFVILMSATGTNAVGFVVGRISRLYPAFWAAVTLTALFVVVLGGEIFSISLTQYVYNLSMISGYFGVIHVDGVYWTLLVELKFYFLIFILLITRLLKYVFYFMAMWAAVSAISFFYDLNTAIVFFMFPEYSGYFIAGGTFYIIKREGVSISRILLILFAYALSLYSSIVEARHLEAYFSTPLSVPVVVAVISVFYILFFMVALGKTSIVNKPGMLYLGALTYPLYLIHQNIGFILFDYFDGFNKYIVLFSTIIFVMFMAYLINRQIEARYGKRLKNTLLRVYDFVTTFKLSEKAIKD